MTHRCTPHIWTRWPSLRSRQCSWLPPSRRPDRAGARCVQAFPPRNRAFPSRSAGLIRLRRRHGFTTAGPYSGAFSSRVADLVRNQPGKASSLKAGKHVPYLRTGHSRQTGNFSYRKAIVPGHSHHFAQCAHLRSPRRHQILAAVREPKGWPQTIRLSTTTQVGGNQSEWRAGSVRNPARGFLRMTGGINPETALWPDRRVSRQGSRFRHRDRCAEPVVTGRGAAQDCRLRERVARHCDRVVSPHLMVSMISQAPTTSPMKVAAAVRGEKLSLRTIATARL